MSDFCEIQVRDHDRDRYLIGLCCKPDRRVDLWPLFAFNHEIAKTRETVSESTLGLIRLQWWRDALKKGGVRHQVLDRLYPVIEKYSLAYDDFETLLTGREFDLMNRPPASLAGLEDYAAATTVPLNRMALKILGAECEAEDLRDISVAYAMTGILRAVPFQAAAGRSYIPAGEAIESVAARARALLGGAKPESRYLRASRDIALLYLNRLRAAGHRTEDPRMAAPPTLFVLKAFVGLV